MPVSLHELSAWLLEVSHGVSAWLLGFADSDWAIAAALLASFAESIFFPAPVDPLVLAVALVQRPIAIIIGVLVTIASVAGAFVGYKAGRSLGRPMLARMFSEQRVGLVDRLFERYGVWAILIAAFTPIPYKVFVIAAGVWRMDMKRFLLASAVGRGLRFITLCALVYVYGESIEAFIRDNFGLMTAVVGTAALALAVGWFVAQRLRRERADT